VTLAVVTAPRWKAGEGAPASSVSRAAAALTGLVFLQLLVGAVMRHTKAGLAIPDFPLAFGKIVPPLTSFAVAIHFAHRVGALLVVAGATVCVTRAARSGRPALAKLGFALALSVCTQIALGALTVLSKKDVVLTTAHVTTGAIVLGLSLGLSLASRRTASSSLSLRERVGVRGERADQMVMEALSWK
jgi:cytochrome c oxidase assembly protein subunit 15